MIGRFFRRLFGRRPKAPTIEWRGELNRVDARAEPEPVERTSSEPETSGGFYTDRPEEVPIETPGPPAPLQGEDRRTGDRRSGDRRALPPPPPPPPPPAPMVPAPVQGSVPGEEAAAPAALEPFETIESLKPAPGRVHLMMEDGTIEEVPIDPEVAERARYLAENLINRAKRKE
jgi:hypothetical protein